MYILKSKTGNEKKSLKIIKKKSIANQCVAN